MASSLLCRVVVSVCREDWTGEKTTISKALKAAAVAREQVCFA